MYYIIIIVIYSGRFLEGLIFKNSQVKKILQLYLFGWHFYALIFLKLKPLRSMSFYNMNLIICNL